VWNSVSADRGPRTAKPRAFSAAMAGAITAASSPDHGTALDIAGKTMADARSMIAAVQMAADMADARAR
jgi:4-hydroxy-L-threonine phosphate dehydrogenase PdxA